MLYLRARWYRGNVGRFTSPDPIIPNYQNPQSVNRYIYAFGNPISFNDPTGYTPVGAVEDLSGRLAVLYYREIYLSHIVGYSQEFSINRVDLEAAMYTMGGFEGFVFDLLRAAGVRQDKVWSQIAFLLGYWARGFRYEGFPVCDNPLARLLAGWSSRADVPSLGIAQIDPPTALDIEASGVLPDEYLYREAASPDMELEEWLTQPEVGIRYLAAYVRWSQIELERFTNETGGSFGQEAEWHFIGWNLNGGNPTTEINEMIELLQLGATLGERTMLMNFYWGGRGYFDARTANLYAHYMESPIAQDLTLSDLFPTVPVVVLLP